MAPRAVTVRAWSAAGALALAMPGCEFDERPVGPGTARPVVHAVLSTAAGVSTYVVLLERTLTGRIDATAVVRDPRDPIASGNGDPIRGARVEITRLDEAGARAAVGIEDGEVRDEKGAGVYRFVNAGCDAFDCPSNAQPIVAGGRYRLRITLPEGDVVEGETTVPQAPDSIVRFGTMFLDREHDTLRLAWPAVTGAHRYAVQVQTPYGPFQLFTDTNAVVLTGGLRNFLTQRIPMVFTPGFAQDVTVAAVDRNYYDYYRSGNDPFTGSGLLTGLQGGTGLFGSWAPVVRGTLEIVAPWDEPVEGNFLGVSGIVDLYATGPSLVSGRLQSAGARHGIVGTRGGNQLRLVVLQGTGVNDTLFTARGEVVADTLTLRVDAGPTFRFFR